MPDWHHSFSQKLITLKIQSVLNNVPRVVDYSSHGLLVSFVIVRLTFSQSPVTKEVYMFEYLIFLQGMCICPCEDIACGSFLTVVIPWTSTVAL